MDWSYIAGYFDGEGTAGVYHYSKGHNANRKNLKAQLSWSNSHLLSLQEIQKYMGCGILKGRKKINERYKPMYEIIISKFDDIRRVAPLLLPHLIIKREAVDEVLVAIEGRKPRSSFYGSLSHAGAEEIRRLYWEEKLTQYEIAERYGVSQSAVRHFMKRRGIGRRELSTAGEIYWSKKVDPIRENERRLKLSEARKLLWQDPAYREKALAAIRAGQPKRIASLKANE